MNAAADEGAARARKERFAFGRYQAYIALMVAAVSALALIAAVFALIFTGQFSFWAVIGLAVFYAITQAGPKGFLAILDGVRKMFHSRNEPPKTDYPKTD